MQKRLSRNIRFKSHLSWFLTQCLQPCTKLRPLSCYSSQDVSRDDAMKLPSLEGNSGLWHSTLCKCLRGLACWKLGLCDTMLALGPHNITPSDMWTVVPPTKLSDKDRRAIGNTRHDFSPGWLSDSVCITSKPI